MSDKIKSLIPTDLPDHVAPATSKCGISSSDLTICAPVISLPTVRLVKLLCIDLVNSMPLRISLIITICGLGLGISIPTLSVPGMGARILRDLLLRASEISFLYPSILVILTPAAGLILICRTVGQMLHPSISTSRSNS